MKKKLLNIKEPELEGLESSQTIHTEKYEKMCSGENTKERYGWTLFAQEITGELWI